MPAAHPHLEQLRLCHRALASWRDRLRAGIDTLGSLPDDGADPAQMLLSEMSARLDEELQSNAFDGNVFEQFLQPALIDLRTIFRRPPHNTSGAGRVTDIEHRFLDGLGAINYALFRLQRFL